MSRLNYDFDKEPLERRKSSVMMRRGKIIAIFCAVALVTGILIYALIPRKSKKAAPANDAVPATPQEQSSEPSPQSTAAAEAAETPAANPGGKTPQSASAAQTEQPKNDAVQGRSPAVQPVLPAVSGKGVVLPSDPPAAQDQPLREGAPAADLNALKAQADSGNLEPLTKAFSAAAPGSQAWAQYGLALGAARVRARQNGSWKKDAINHRVNAGESLGKLAIRHHTTKEFIKKANDLKDDTIRIGQKLAILPGPWSVQIDKKARLLTVFQFKNGVQIPYGAFEIGVGRDGRTPKGDFVISHRLRHPEWRPADGRIIPYGDQENVLGDYFLKLAVKGKADKPLRGYGIHGTNDETTVGRSLSNGCIRMHKADVEMLYYLLPSGTPVHITE